MENIRSYIAAVESSPGRYCQRIHQLIRTKVQPLLESLDDPSCPVEYDEGEPKKLMRFIDGLVADKAGTRVRLTDWQRFLIELAYGFKYKADGRILFSELFLFIAKKNGKTGLVAALALWEALTKAASSVYLVAVTYQQTKLALDAIKEYIENSPVFADALAAGEFFINSTRPPLAIVYYPNGSKIEAFPETNVKSAQGKKPDLILFDEIASYKSNTIIQKLSSGAISITARRYFLTTAETTPENPGRTEYDRAVSVLGGRFIASNYLPLLYELDKGDDPDNPDTYIKANPSLDVIKPRFRLLEERDRAKQSPVDYPSFQAYQLNIWSRNMLRGISEREWDKAIAAARAHTEHIAEGLLPEYPCAIGCDLSKVNDWTALTRSYWIPKIGKYYNRHRFYIPESKLLDKMRSDSEQLELWVRSGLLVPTVGGDVINYEYLVRDIKEWCKAGNVKVFAYDPFNSSRFVDMLDGEIPELPKLPFEMNWRKTGPANRFFYESLLRGDLIDDNPIMAWMAGCVSLATDINNNIKFEKIDYRTSSKRIDGVISSSVAMAMIDQWRKENDSSDIDSLLAALDSIPY